jgi:hypothetical protein
MFCFVAVRGEYQQRFVENHNRAKRVFSVFQSRERSQISGINELRKASGLMSFATAKVAGCNSYVRANLL